MKKKKKVNKYNLIIVVLLPLFIILLSTRLIIFDESFYEKQFQKNNLYKSFEKEKVDFEVNNLFDYFINDKGFKTNFFNQKERLHLKDVKDLINGGINLLLTLSFIFLGFFIYYIKYKKLKVFYRSIFYGSILSLVLIGIFLLFVLLDFNFVFLKFHEISFNNNLWLLNPETDNLIKLFPLEFFYDFVLKIVLYSVIASIIFGFLSFTFG